MLPLAISLALAASASSKELILIRHGVTNMNCYLRTCPYGTPGFVDPGDFDTRLTAEGVAQAEGLQPRLQAAHAAAPIELLISSPLTRALQTATAALGPTLADCVRQEASPLIAERRWLSSDVGRAPGAGLATEFPKFGPSLEALPDRWWWEGDEAMCAAAAEERRSLQNAGRLLPWSQQRELEGVALPVEPSSVFLERLERFRTELLQRRERRIAVVAHWGVLRSLLGVSLENCGVVECTTDELLTTLLPPPD